MTTDTSGSAVRVGDSERECTADQLGQAFTQGYLSMEDYETRLTRAFEAQTAGALQDLVADLPVAQIVRADPRRRARRDAAARRGVRIHLSAYLAVSVLMIGIWLVTAIFAGAWYFWPVWPILGWGIGIISHAVPVGACARNAARAAESGMLPVWSQAPRN